MGDVAVALIPGAGGELLDRFIGGGLAQCGGADCHAAFGQVAEDEAAGDAGVEDFASHEGLGVLDEVGIGALGGQQSDRGGRDGQAAEGLEDPGAAEQQAQHIGGLGRAGGHVDMGVGAIGDQAVAGGDQALAHIAVKVMGDHDGHARADHGADHGEEAAIAILIAGGAAGAVAGDIDGIERHGGEQAAARGIEHAQEQRLIDRPARRGGPDGDGLGCPGAGLVHAAVEAGHFGGEMRGLGPGEAGDFRALFPALGAEIRLQRGRREGIGLQMQPQNSDPWHHDLTPNCAAPVRHYTGLKTHQDRAR